MIIRIKSQLIAEVYEKALKCRDLNSPSGVGTGVPEPSRGKSRSAGAGSRGKIYQLMAADVDK